MKFEKSEKKQGSGQNTAMIGYFKADLVAVNPSAEQVKKLYNIDGDVEDTKYQGEDRNGKDWSLLRFIFQEELKKTLIEYKVFMSKELSEWDNSEKEHKIEYINQWGQTQVVDDEKNLWESFKTVQRWNKDESKWETATDEDGSPMKLSYQVAYKGESELYSLLRALVRIDWFTATDKTNLFIKIDDLMRGKVTEISSMIGTDDIRSVVGMAEVEVKDTDDGTKYYSNCTPRAWMDGYRIAQCNLTTTNNEWGTLDTEAAKKNKKLYDIRNFYYWTKKSKKNVAYKYLGEFNPEEHLNATDAAIQHSTTPTDMNYD